MAYEGEVEICHDQFHPITADTITDDQICDLRSTADSELKRICNLALLAPNGIGMKHEYREARDQCAKVINDRRLLPEHAR